MKGNKKLVVYGILAAILLVCICIFLFIKLFSGKSASNKVNGDETEIQTSVLLKAVPTDAVFIAIVNKSEHFNSKGNKFALEDDAPWQDGIFANLPALLSLHYSSRNEVSALYVADLNNADEQSIMQQANSKGCRPLKNYNGTIIYTIGGEGNSTYYFSFCESFYLCSKSSHVVETSIRHLSKKVSILDNGEFSILAQKYNGMELMYINHSQIGKFFSGCIEYNWLKYSDFFMRLSNWTVCSFSQKQDHVNIIAELLCGTDVKNYSTVFVSQKSQESNISHILPNSTIFYCNTAVSNNPDFTKRLGRFLEVHKKLRDHETKLELVSKGKMKPKSLIDSMGIKEVAVAWCEFGDSYRWISLVRVKKKGKLAKLWSRFVVKDSLVASPYSYKGYLEALYGELFSHTEEEYITNVMDWCVIGPKDIIESYALGDANYYSFNDYLSQTPAKGFLGSAATTQLFVNMYDGKDSLMKIIKEPLKKVIDKMFLKNDFCALTASLYPEKEERESYIADIDLYCTKLKAPPVPRVREVQSGRAITDSTITVPVGPYVLKDFVNGGECYLEQQKNFKLSYLNETGKRMWTIDFSEPLTGYVEQADLFNNGKLQMIFTTKDKVYALDRLGRFVRGYPRKLDKEIVLGPKLLDLKKNKEYTFVALAADNTIIWRELKSGKPVEGFIDIHSDQFVKALPDNIVINGSTYWIVRNSYTVEIYTVNGEKVEIKSKRKIIAPDSPVSVYSATELKVKGIDGKDFVVDVITGKTKNI